MLPQVSGQEPTTVLPQVSDQEPTTVLPQADEPAVADVVEPGFGIAVEPSPPDLPPTAKLSAGETVELAVHPTAELGLGRPAGGPTPEPKAGDEPGASAAEGPSDPPAAEPPKRAPARKRAPRTPRTPRTPGPRPDAPPSDEAGA